MKYICTFEHFFNGSTITSPQKATGDSINDFAEGFWIDKELQLVKGGGWRWIPPSRIRFIEKVEDEQKKD